MEQKGPKIGWTFGGLGGILWIILLSIVMFFKGNYSGAVIAAAFFLAGIVYIVAFAPWKYPHSPFWKIYGGLLAIIIVAAAAIIYFWYPQEFRSMSNMRMLFMLFPLFLPVFILGRKTWTDIHQK